MKSRRTKIVAGDLLLSNLTMIKKMIKAGMNEDVIFLMAIILLIKIN